MNTGKQPICPSPCGWSAPDGRATDMQFSCVHNTYSFKKSPTTIACFRIFGSTTTENIQKPTGVGFKEYSAE